MILANIELSFRRHLKIISQVPAQALLIGANIQLSENSLSFTFRLRL